MATSTDTTNPSRRHALGFLASAPALAIATGGMLAVSADAALIELGRQFDEAWEIEKLVSATALDTPEGEAQVSAAVDAASAIVAKIESTPALTSAGLKVKGRAVMWCHSGEASIGDDFLSDQLTTDVRLATSILRDIIAMKI